MKQFLVLLCLICSFGVNAQVYSLEFNKDNYSAQTFVFNGQEYKVRAFENIIYVANPVDTVYQKMNIYVPEEYFNGCTVGDYDQISAPVFFPNVVGCYMPSGPMNLLGNTGRHGFGHMVFQPTVPRPPGLRPSNQCSAIPYALMR